jgi:hypothetical protein
MIDDRIGSIGSTHGVKLSSRPSTKKIGSTVSSDRDLNAVSTRPASVGVDDGEAADAKLVPGGCGALEAAPSIRWAVRVSGG